MISPQYIEFKANTKGIEMLNWEKDRRSHMAVEASYDYLPKTGSFADQRRWEKENGCRSPDANHKTKNSLVALNEVAHYCNQLALYVRCIESAYFWKKSPKDQIEIIEVIKKITQRIKPEIGSISNYNQALFRKAEALLVRFSN